MSTFEYNDMFYNCQDTGIYHMFTFDLANSRHMNTLSLLDAKEKLLKIILDIYNELKELEKKLNIKILLEQELYINEYFMNTEPYILGDAVGISIYRDSISTEEFINLFIKYKNIHCFNYELHINHGYYETTYWIEGNKKYARTYCFDLLSNRHKYNSNK